MNLRPYNMQRIEIENKKNERMGGRESEAYQYELEEKNERKGRQRKERLRDSFAP